MAKFVGDLVGLSNTANGEFVSRIPQMTGHARASSVLLEAESGAGTGGSGFKKILRLPISYRGIPAFVATLDFAIIVVSAIISGASYNYTINGGAGEFSRSLAAAVFVAILFVGSTYLRQFYSASRLMAWNEQLRYFIGAWCGTFLLLASGVFAWGVGQELSRGILMLFWVFGGLALLIHRALWRIYLPIALRSGALKGRKTVVVTWDEPVSAGLSRSMSKHGNDIVAQLVIKGDEEQMHEGVRTLVEFARGESIDDIFLVPKTNDPAGFGKVLGWLRVLPFPVILLPDPATTQLLRSPSFELGPHLALEIQRPPLSQMELVVKRTFDIVFSLLVLVAILPLLVFVAMVVALDSPGPVLFRQTRHGFNGQAFMIFKFRTMTVLEDGENVSQAKFGDQRVTRAGAWLRRTSIDELPQLLNVLRGEMSLVGPRPHATSHDRYFEQVVDNYAFRQHVKSGITGWAQVNGARGETDTVEKIRARVDLDLWYIKHWSLKLDLMILLRTASVVTSGKNAF